MQAWGLVGVRCPWYRGSVSFSRTGGGALPARVMEDTWKEVGLWKGCKLKVKQLKSGNTPSAGIEVMP